MVVKEVGKGAVVEEEDSSSLDEEQPTGFSEDVFDGLDALSND